MTTQYVQQQLSQMKYHSGTIDGVWGRATERGYQRFVREQLLLSDAALDWNMLQLLRD
ncbi:MAG: hypothetical protein V7731_08565 [Amphritea sp.]